ncbi:MAG: ATP-dependent RecD-like DNA helicase, partial [Lentisphaerae bacterium]|nr:ATP-dependent RecD-like DNA helicase [Lentisphaerota bacterium]
MAGEPEEISGVVDHIVYRSEETGYTVCVLKTKAQSDGITIVGNCAAIWDGETLKATGQWTRHKEHGRQFQADKMVCVEPSSEEGIRKFLASGLIKGIGEVLAGRLVAKFGTDTLRIIDQESALLLSVDGIGRMRKDQIKTAWNEQKAIRDIMLFLHQNGASTSQAFRIYRQYGDDSIALIKANPYRLCYDIWGIGFKTADRIAMTLGVPAQSLIRARAGLVHVLQTLTDQGDCYCPRDELISEAAALLGIPEEIIREALVLEIGQSIIDEDSHLYPASLHQAEAGVASHLRRIRQQAPAFAPIVTDRAIAWAASRMQLEFSPGQAQALGMALSEKVSIITGGPGVGKTTIIRGLVDIFKARRLKVLLAAPTGRAAKRLEESTRHEAMTLHRLLRYLPGTRAFEHGSDKPLDADIVILDEVSMIDIVLMNAFLRAVPNKACLVLVGDADQLPSVGPGNVLRDMINSSVIPVTRLDTIFRQKERSWIVHNAHRVNTGEFLELPEEGGDLSDFYFIEADDPDTVIQRLVPLVTERIPLRFGLNPRTDIQVLTPMRRFQLGAENLNLVLQAALNPRGDAMTWSGRTFRTGDRVMQLRNNYDKVVFNGDIGFVRSVDAVNQALRVDFDGTPVDYDRAELDELSLAYASSIHKAQGNEHPAVVIVM